MKQNNKKSIFIIIIIMLICIIIGVFGILLEIKNKDKKIEEPVVNYFDEDIIEEICDFEVSKVCAKELGNIVIDGQNIMLHISYEKKSDDLFSAYFSLENGGLVKLEDSVGKLYMIKKFEDYIILDIKQDNRDLLKIFNYSANLIETEKDIIALSNITYNSDSITYKTLNCDDEISKDYLFDAVLTIENSKINITYTQTEEKISEINKCE